MKLKNIVYKFVAVLSALFAWQAAAHFTSLPILLPSPVDVIKGFVSIWGGQPFTVPIITTFSNIISGFLWGFFLGAFFGLLGEALFFC